MIADNTQNTLLMREKSTSILVVVLSVVAVLNQEPSLSIRSELYTHDRKMILVAHAQNLARGLHGLTLDTPFFFLEVTHQLSRRSLLKVVVCWGCEAWRYTAVVTTNAFGDDFCCRYWRFCKIRIQAWCYTSWPAIFVISRQFGDHKHIGNDTWIDWKGGCVLHRVVGSIP